MAPTWAGRVLVALAAAPALAATPDCASPGRTRLTRARVKRLEAQRDCAEGDLSCNAPLR